MRPLDLRSLSYAGREVALAARLAALDFVHERRLSLCSVMGLAAVLAPLFVLYGLKFGMISGMADTLARDPRARELRPIGHGVYDSAFFEALAARPEVGYLEPTTRFLAATVGLRNRADDGSEPVTAELWPAGPGDPYFEGVIGRPLVNGELVLSRSAADKLRVASGGVLDGRIGRRIDGNEQVVRLGMTVAAVLPSGLVERDVAFVGRPMLLATEDYREGYAVPAFGWSGTAPSGEPRSFSSFRLFARDINAVEALRDHLAGLGIETLTRLADIRMIQSLDRNLMILFAIVAGLGISGYTLALAVSLWAMTERKRRDLAALRLIGFSSRAIAFLPATNAALTAMLGVMLASTLYRVIEPLLNVNLADRIAAGSIVARLTVVHYLIAAAGTLLCSLAASIAAGLNAARQEPAEGLRDV